jgi:hypothetical protein
VGLEEVKFRKNPRRYQLTKIAEEEKQKPNQQEKPEPKSTEKVMISS